MMQSDQVAQLQSDIYLRSRKNRDGAQFVPFEWLADLCSPEIIQHLLQTENIEQYERRSIAKDIHTYGLRTFATLVLIGKPDLIYNFFRLDPGVHKGSPDNKLPMHTEELNEVLGISDDKNSTEGLEGLRDSFIETQFTFLTPTFPLGIPHRRFPDRIRLPFIKAIETADKEAKKPWGGHFGKVYKEKLPSPKYDEDERHGMTVVRKELKTSGDDEYKGELRCLRLLNAVRHDSILELYGSYTQARMHNFLFREAAGGDLHDLLRSEDRPLEFRDDEAIYLALCGLVSALEQLHHYSNDDLSVRLIGCHHDLKPRNILVDGARFILADFGLSKMSDTEQDLRTIAPERDAYFDAPEGRDFTTMSRKEIGPASDIWSLGGILAVLFAWMKGGPKAVDNFKDERRYLFDVEHTNSTLILKSFHHGGQIHNNMLKWLDDKMKKRTAIDEALVALIKDMLIIEPSERLGISKVLCRLRGIALKESAKSIAMDELALHLKDRLEYAVERQVFLEWLSRIGNSEDATATFLHSDIMFTQTYDTVCNIREEFRLLAAAAPHDYPLLARLRLLNNQLLSTTLDEGVQRSVRTIAELKILPTVSGNAGITTSSAGSEGQPGPNENIKMLLSAKNVQRHFNKSDSTVRRLDPREVKFPVMDDNMRNGRKLVQTYRIGTLVLPESISSVIVEELEIGLEYNDEDKSEQLIRGLQQVLSLPPSRAANFRALSCAGIYHDISKQKIGLVYHFPDTHSTDGAESSVQSLADMLKQHIDLDRERMVYLSMDERLALACNLATALFEFHKINWWHKNVSSYNVLLFSSRDEDHAEAVQGSPRRQCLGSPALIGFSHSRPGDSAYSNKMHSIDVTFRYRHPDYSGADTDARPTSPYQAEYDYYGLGLVLLEIGLWFPLEGMLKDDTMDRKDMRSLLLRDWVPYLRATVGDAYARAVEVCLSGLLSENGKTKEKVDENFERLVLQPLEWYRPKP